MAPDLGLCGGTPTGYGSGLVTASRWRSRSVAYRVRYLAGGTIVADPVEVLPPVDEPQVDARREANRRRYHRRVLNTRGERYRLAEVAQRDGFICHLCSAPVDMSLSGRHPWGPTADHVVPVAHGGGDEPENIRLAHSRCNVKRRTRPLVAS